jgi:hypothetical protein
MTSSSLGGSPRTDSAEQLAEIRAHADLGWLADLRDVYWLLDYADDLRSRLAAARSETAEQIAQAIEAMKKKQRWDGDDWIANQNSAYSDAIELARSTFTVHGPVQPSRSPANNTREGDGTNPLA